MPTEILWELLFFFADLLKKAPVAPMGHPLFLKTLHIQRTEMGNLERS